MPETQDTGPLEKARRELHALNIEAAEIKQEVHDIMRILTGNGRGGLIERVALLEQQAGIGRYLLTAAIGAGAAVLTALLLRGVP